MPKNKILFACYRKLEDKLLAKSSISSKVFNVQIPTKYGFCRMVDFATFRQCRRIEQFSKGEDIVTVEIDENFIFCKGDFRVKVSKTDAQAEFEKLIANKLKTYVI